jgi:hypothetical protein
MSLKAQADPISPHEGEEFYRSLAAEDNLFEGESLEINRGRMEATKTLLIEAFKNFEGSVIYPCALVDLRSVIDLHRLFPRAKIVLNDLISPQHISNLLTTGERPDGMRGIVNFLEKGFAFDRTSDWQNRREIKDLTFKVKRSDEQCPVFDVSFSLDTTSYNPLCIPEFLLGVSKIDFEYRVTNLFEDSYMPCGIVFLRRPGWQGNLMQQQKFWDRVNALIGNNRYLLTAIDQGYRDGIPFIYQYFDPLLINTHIDRCQPVLPLFKIGGAVTTQVFVKKSVARDMP